MVHRYNAALPPSMSASAAREAAELTEAVLAGFRAAAVAGPHPNFGEGMKQLKRLNALAALKYELSDEHWAEIVNALFALALHGDVDLPRQVRPRSRGRRGVLPISCDSDS